MKHHPSDKEFVMSNYRGRLFGWALAAAFGAVGALCLAEISHSIAQNDVPKATKPMPEKKKELNDFMRQKLDATNYILEGLLTENFDFVARGAKQLKEMSRAEKWRVSNDAMYRAHSDDFLQRVEKLLKTAKDDDASIDAATLAYFDTTMSCIECHKWVRRVLIADGQAPQKKPVAAQ